MSGQRMFDLATRYDDAVAAARHVDHLSRITHRSQLHRSMGHRRHRHPDSFIIPAQAEINMNIVSGGGAPQTTGIPRPCTHKFSPTDFGRASEHISTTFTHSVPLPQMGDSFISDPRLSSTAGMRFQHYSGGNAPHNVSPSRLEQSYQKSSESQSSSKPTEPIGSTSSASGAAAAVYPCATTTDVINAIQNVLNTIESFNGYPLSGFVKSISVEQLVANLCSNPSSRGSKVPLANFDIQACVKKGLRHTNFNTPTELKDFNREIESQQSMFAQKFSTAYLAEEVMKRCDGVGRTMSSTVPNLQPNSDGLSAVAIDERKRKEYRTADRELKSKVDVASDHRPEDVFAIRSDLRSLNLNVMQDATINSLPYVVWNSSHTLPATERKHFERDSNANLRPQNLSTPGDVAQNQDKTSVAQISSSNITALSSASPKSSTSRNVPKSKLTPTIESVPTSPVLAYLESNTDRGVLEETVESKSFSDPDLITTCGIFDAGYSNRGFTNSDLTAEFKEEAADAAHAEGEMMTGESAFTSDVLSTVSSEHFPEEKTESVPSENTPCQDIPKTLPQFLLDSPSDAPLHKTVDAFNRVSTAKKRSTTLAAAIFRTGPNWSSITKRLDNHSQDGCITDGDAKSSAKDIADLDCTIRDFDPEENRLINSYNKDLIAQVAMLKAEKKSLEEENRVLKWRLEQKPGPTDLIKEKEMGIVRKAAVADKVMDEKRTQEKITADMPFSGVVTEDKGSDEKATSELRSSILTHPDHTQLLPAKSIALDQIHGEHEGKNTAGRITPVELVNEQSISSEQIAIAKSRRSSSSSSDGEWEKL